MENQPRETPGSVPPRLPGALDYRDPKRETGKEIGHLGDAQKVFDTVTGPNLRLRDNLIQAGAIAVAVVLAIPIVFLFMHDWAGAIILGILCGLIGGVLISGIGLGIYRFVKARGRQG